jgi:hypothetical protein
MTLRGHPRNLKHRFLLTLQRFQLLPLYSRLLIFIALASCLSFLVIAPRVLAEYNELSRGLQRFVDLRLERSVVPILIPVYSRPHYLRRVLASLERSSHISDSVLVFSQDGFSPEISELIEGVSFAPVIKLSHSPPYFGIPSLFIRTDAPTAANVFFLLRFAFDYAKVDAAVVLESDIELSVDGFDFFRWAYRQVDSSPDLRHRVLTINGFNEASDPAADVLAFNVSTPGFMVWGWCAPHFSWPLIKSQWTWFHNWDITLEGARRRSGKLSLAPLVSRTKNIGMSGINFNVQDVDEQAKWLGLYTPQEPIFYDNAVLKLVGSQHN